MAQLGSYKIPKEYKDEDKWFRFFTKLQLFMCGGALGIGILICIVFSAIHLFGLGLAIAETIVGLTFVVSFVTMPTDRYLIGGGYPLYKIIMRLANRLLPGNRILYIKHYKKED